MRTSETKKADGYCKAARNFKTMNLKKGVCGSSEVVKARIIKEVISDIVFGRKSMSDIPNEVEAKMTESLKGVVATACGNEAKALIERYLLFPEMAVDISNAEKIPAETKTLVYEGENLAICPDLVFLSGNTVKVISISKGKQKMTNKKGLKNPERNCLYVNTDSLAMFLYGAEILKEHGINNGTVNVIYDALKNGSDKGSCYSPDYKESKPGKSTYSDNRVRAVFDVVNGLPIIPKTFKEGLDVFKKGVDCCSGADCDFCNFKALCRDKGTDNSETAKDDCEPKTVSYPVLTKTQSEVSLFEKGVMLVNAGAGSGKTTTIAWRCANLVQTDNAKDILIISFSVSAVSEMKSRLAGIAKLTEEEDIAKIRVCTFNELGREFIIRHYKELGFSGIPKLISGLEKYELVIEAADKYGMIEGLNYSKPHFDFGRSKGAFKYLAAEFETIENFGYTKDQYIAAANTATADKVYDNYLVFKKIKKSKNLYSHADEIGALSNSLLEDEIPYKHIVVDEFQDTNAAQLAYINYAVCGLNFKSLLLVGDYAQSIFGFRGTSPLNMLNLSELLMEDFSEVDMVENFRSTKEVVDAGNKLLKLTGQGRRVSPYSHSAEKGEFASIPVFSVDDMAEEIKMSGYPLRSWAVIAHNNATLEKYNKEFTTRGVASVVRSKRRIIEDSMVKGIIGLAKFLANDDEIGLATYLSGGGIGVNELASMAQNVAEALRNISENSDENFLNYVLGLMREYGKNNAVYMTLYEEILKRHFTDITELTSFLIKYEEFEIKEAVTVHEDLSDAVTLITAHSSKGLEWDNVIIDTSDFKFDSKDAEAVRLLYVCITRAGKRCYLVGKNLLADIA